MWITVDANQRFGMSHAFHSYRYWEATLSAPFREELAPVYRHFLFLSSQSKQVTQVIISRCTQHLSGLDTGWRRTKLFRHECKQHLLPLVAP